MRTTTTMKARLTSLLIALIMVFSMIPLSTLTAFASGSNPSYVALGDSISTGYGLEGYIVGTTPTNSFTYLLADDLGYELTNLAADGNTAPGILAQLDNDIVKTAVTNADLITITAGGNDLMAALYQALADYYNTQNGLTGDAAVSGNDIVDAFAGNNPNLDLTFNDINAMLGIIANFSTTDAFTGALNRYKADMFGESGVIETILALNPDVAIVVATQYNPYKVFNGAFLYGNIYTGIEAGLSGDNGLNAAIKSNADSKGYIVADVYTAFTNSTENLCNAGTVEGNTNLDFHPNAAGHALIAQTFGAVVPSVYVGGVGMADGDYLANGATATTDTAPTTGGYAHYEDGKLTLNNYSYSGLGYPYDDDYTAGIYSLSALEIVLVGQNSIVNTYPDSDGITPVAGLTVSGDGSLDISAEYGIYTWNGDIAINGGMLNIFAEYGIMNEGGSVAFNGGVTIINAGDGDLAVYASDEITLESVEILYPTDADIVSADDGSGGYTVISDPDGNTDLYVAIGANGTPFPEVYVGGVGMANGTYLANDANKTTAVKPTEGGYAHYANGTLTLNNYTYEGVGYVYFPIEAYSSVIYSPVILTVVLEGQNSIVNTNLFSDGVTSDTGLTVSGDGSLDISAEYGIYAWNGDVAINGGILNIVASGCGILNGGGSVAFNGGTTAIDVNEEWENGVAVGAAGDITLGEGIEILEPSGAEMGTDDFNDNVICDAEGNANIDVKIGVPTYTVSFDPNGGIGSMESVNVPWGEYTLPENEFPVPAGFQFGGWATSANGAVIEGNTVNVSSNITLFAIWAPQDLRGEVTVSGDTQVGSTLTATVTGSNNTGTLSYQWYRYVESDTAIAGATSSTYTLTADDITYGIFCVVSSSVQKGSIQGDANGIVKPAPFTVEAVCDPHSGTVTGGGSYEKDATVTLTATPADGMKFEYWLDPSLLLNDEPTEAELKAAIVGYDATYTFTAAKNVRLEAVFSVLNEISVIPMSVEGTDANSLSNAKELEFDIAPVVFGAEPIVLPGTGATEIITVGGKQYRFAGFIIYGYDEENGADTVALQNTLGEMPLYGSAEYWNWIIRISDGIYVAYTPYTPANPQTPTEPQTPTGSQTPTEPQTPQTPTNPQTPQSPTNPQTPTDSNNPQTGDNNIALWFVLLLISGGAIATLAVYDRKRRNAVNGK